MLRRGFLMIVCCLAVAASAQTRVTIDSDNIISINGKPTFTIGFTVPPPPNAKAYNGKPALEEFRDAGATFIRTGPMLNAIGQWDGSWDPKWIAMEHAYMDAAASAGMFCAPWLKELSYVADGDAKKEADLRRVVRLFKDHPALGVWKGEDEPQWGEMNKTGSKPPGPLVNAYRIIKDEDPNHPIWIVQAPRGTVEQLRAYNPAYDIGGVDVYPISYPPGSHVPADHNKDISMVGDYTRRMIDVVENKKPVWFTLQIAWSGVARPGKTLRFPTFPEQRFMTYQAIINGARGLIYFGGNLPTTLNEQDKPLGWNWTYWRRVLRPVIEEVGDKSPLARALVQPDSKLPVKVSGNGIEFCVREVDSDLYLLACSRELEKTQQVEFTALPAAFSEADVLYESPRRLSVRNGQFTDWFAPRDVHVYRLVR